MPIDQSEQFSETEARAIEPYFSNLDRPVFALRNLSEVVKGALFARYSRSPKSLRRLFLEEFLDELPDHAASEEHQVGTTHAEGLYTRVFDQYGDDSVAQLGGAHIACEGASNILTKVLEWGRLIACLEQSTRYIPYTDRSSGHWRYLVPSELRKVPQLEGDYRSALDSAFEFYSDSIGTLEDFYTARHPKAEGDSSGVYKRTIRAKALDTVRGLLPAATQSNVGLFGSGQAYETMLLRMMGHPLEEVRRYAAWILTELKTVIPSFVSRIGRPERGGVWAEYLAQTKRDSRKLAQSLVLDVTPQAVDEVRLTDFEAEGETKVIAAALYEFSQLPDEQLLTIAKSMDEEQRTAFFRGYVGTRKNRRHKPGRAFERTSYRFDILTDYGAFRDLQRHRLLTLNWQTLTPDHGYAIPEAVEELGLSSSWKEVMERCAEVYDKMSSNGLGEVSSYVVPMAYRVRFYMEMNAREAMHVIELRTSPQGHSSYRRVCQKMHDLIREVAGHQQIADAMSYVDHSEVELERLQAERASERKREEQSST